MIAPFHQQRLRLNLAALTRFIMLLLVALCAPAGMVRRVRGFKLRQLWLFARGLELMREHGDKLRYPGEGLAVVAARIDMLAWLAVDPMAARTHLARRQRGWRRARAGSAAPPSFAPPQEPAPVLRDADSAPPCADSS